MLHPVKLERIDGRHRAHGYMKYQTRRFAFQALYREQFFQWQRWAGETWGFTVPIQAYYKLRQPSRDQLVNANWSYHHDSDLHSMTLYLADDAQAELFLLRWS